MYLVPAFILVVTSLFTALAAVLLMSFLPPMKSPAAKTTRKPAPPDGDDDDIVFLFRDEDLVDATDPALAILARGPDGMGDWDRLKAYLGPRFEGFQTRMSELVERGSVEMDDLIGENRLSAQWLGQTARITLSRIPNAADKDPDFDLALGAEVRVLRDVVADMPTAAWIQDPDGTVVWANRAYLTLIRDSLGEDDPLVWPLPRLFDTASADQADGRRLSLTLANGSQRWFDCSVMLQGDRHLIFAGSADTAVHAETSLRNFTQTLTKTFAGLPTGLAIFNRSRDLMMFNPALLDLCMLEPQFLAARPSLHAFLDKLREKRVIPEPKNYLAWRKTLVEFEENAESGLFEETWQLPNGQTFRVTGQPHPDGALAFLIEDITSEIAMTRRFRAELELSQAVMDSMDEAIAVFSPGGVLTLSNAAYADLWGSDPSMTLGEVGIHDATHLWQEQCGPSPLWQKLRAMVSGSGTRKSGRGIIQKTDGETLSWRANTIGGGAMLIAFKQVVATNSPTRADANVLANVIL